MFSVSKHGKQSQSNDSENTSQLISYYGTDLYHYKQATDNCLQFTTVYCNHSCNQGRKACLIWTMSIFKNSRTTTVHYSLHGSSNFSFLVQLQLRRKSLKCDSNLWVVTQISRTGENYAEHSQTITIHHSPTIPLWPLTSKRLVVMHHLLISRWGAYGVH